MIELSNYRGQVHYLVLFDEHLVIAYKSVGLFAIKFYAHLRKILYKSFLIHSPYHTR